MEVPDDELFSCWQGMGIGSGLLWIGPGTDKEEKTVRIKSIDSELSGKSLF